MTLGKTSPGADLTHVVLQRLGAAPALRSKALNKSRKDQCLAWGGIMPRWEQTCPDKLPASSYELGALSLVAPLAQQVSQVGTEGGRWGAWKPHPGLLKRGVPPEHPASAVEQAPCSQQHQPPWLCHTGPPPQSLHPDSLSSPSLPA